MCNKMLSHYNHVLIGCFKDIFQSVDTNNLTTVLQALRVLNFMLANRAPELAAHYCMPLEPCQVSAEEVPDFVNAHLNRSTTYNIEHSSRGRPRTRGLQHNRYTRQASPVPRYNQQSCRSDIHSHSDTDRLYDQTSYNNRNRCHLHSSLNHLCNIPNNPYHITSNMQHNTDMHSSNTSDILGSLQSQLLGLQMQLLQQSTLNSIKIFDGSNKAEFTAWAQSMENTARLCHLDALSIALSKLHGAPLKSANYFETKEANAGKTLICSTLKQHSTSNYSEIPYDTHAINAHDTLQQGNDESTEAYLHRAQDILECIHHTNDMSSISAIGTNHTKILTCLKDGRLCNKLAESKAKKWINMSQVLQDIADMAVNFERSCGYSLPTFEVNQASSYNNHPSGNAYRSTKPPAKEVQQLSFKADKMKCWHCHGNHLKKDCPTAPQQNSSSQSKSYLSKEKLHNLIKSFCKRFQNKTSQVNEVPYLLKTTTLMTSLISSFQNSRI